MGNGGLFDQIEGAIAPGRDTRWALMLSGERPTDLIKELIHDLATPRQRKIATKFSYIGMAPSIAWANACSDFFYPVMRDSIDAFERYWRRIVPFLAEQQFHYVSLGVGTGQKDRVILNDLHARNPDMRYMPVDISAEMIRLGIYETSKVTTLNMLPVQVDFSVPAHLQDLRTVVHGLVGAEPVLYSLLGNTVANIDDDHDLLATIADLLRPQDRLLLEVSVTSDLSEEALTEARGEYSISETYKIHATSALGQFTDLTINNRMLVIQATVEDDRGIRIETHYENATGQPVMVTLPDHRTQIDFTPGETIRVTLSRKYLPSGVDALVSSAGLERINDRAAHGTVHTRGPVFSGDVILLARSDGLPQRSSVADDLLRK